jgi:neutral ceramidase
MRCSALLCGFFLCSTAANTAELRAGAARRDITPREPVPMWGYGDRHDKLSTGTRDPLHADALVIEAGGKKLAIVGLDLGRAPAERSLQIIRGRIKEQAGIEYSFIAGSHTHHGPALELSDAPGKGQGKFDAALRYYAQMEDGITAAIVEANKNLVPVRFATGSVQLEGWNVNRHTKLEPKPSDRDLEVMRFDDAATGKPVAILVNWTGHPTTIPSSVLEFSADYVGALKNEVTARTGAAAIFMQGAAGDQSVVKDKGTEGYGRALGDEVVKLMSSLNAEAVAVPSLEVREERLQFTSRTDLSNPTVKAMYSKAFFPELIPNFIDEYADGVRPRLTVALLNGDIAMVGVSGEFFSNHAIRLKQRARVKQLFFFGYSNGYHQYFPTIEAVAEGGYGADAGVSPVAIGAGEQIMNTALLRIYQMLGKIK